MRALETRLRARRRSSTRCAPRRRRCASGSASGHVGGGHASTKRSTRSSAAPRRGCARRCGRRCVRVINATGVIVHTNLGRAPLAEAALAARRAVAGGYTNLEYDLARGARGRRDVHAETLLAAPHRRRSRRRRQQQRRGDDAAAGGAGGGTRGDHLARRAGRDRRRLPRARRDGAVGRDPARGRHHQPDARGRLRRRDRRAHRR